jgi:hypothetical protein
MSISTKFRSVSNIIEVNMYNYSRTCCVRKPKGSEFEVRILGEVNIKEDKIKEVR